MQSLQHLAGRKVPVAVLLRLRMGLPFEHPVSRMLAPYLSYNCIGFSRPGVVGVQCGHLELLKEWNVEQLEVDTTSGWRSRPGRFYDNLSRVGQQPKRPHVIITFGQPTPPCVLPDYRLVERTQGPNHPPWYYKCVYYRLNQ
ncbi:uncharacterized protein LOC117642114 [Thrips palmi]|uniref:Uncharacterized protein LOC117642114 n=1 Tax=Thrips palmi TaxID=161013 RepID=A0A6P8Y891_THRPL|nr:uncharacterized protein LOC117642114 [Thrips palmi]